MSSYQEFKTFYSSNIILFVVLLFVIVYAIINWEQIYRGNYFNGQLVKSILVTGIIFLIVHMLITWDDNAIETDYPSDIPMYKLGQNEFDLQPVQPTYQPVQPTYQPVQPPYQPVQQPYQPVQPAQLPSQPSYQPNNSAQQFDSKYKVSNKFDNYQKPNLLQNIFSKNNNNLQNTDNKLSNQNIFISHKNSAKYGLKF
jgi:hypothetical protein